MNKDKLLRDTMEASSLDESFEDLAEWVQHRTCAVKSDEFRISSNQQRNAPEERSKEHCIKKNAPKATTRRRLEDGKEGTGEAKEEGDNILNESFEDLAQWAVEHGASMSLLQKRCEGCFDVSMKDEEEKFQGSGGRLRRLYHSVELYASRVGLGRVKRCGSVIFQCLRGENEEEDGSLVLPPLQPERGIFSCLRSCHGFPAFLFVLTGFVFLLFGRGGGGEAAYSSESPLA